MAELLKVGDTVQFKPTTGYFQPEYEAGTEFKVKWVGENDDKNHQGKRDGGAQYVKLEGIEETHLIKSDRLKKVKADVTTSMLEKVLAAPKKSAKKATKKAAPKKEAAPAKPEIKGPKNLSDQEKLDYAKERENVFKNRKPHKWPPVKGGDIIQIFPEERTKRESPLLWKALYGPGGSRANEERGKLTPWLGLVICAEKEMGGRSGDGFYFVPVDDRKEIIDDYGRPNVMHSNMILSSDIKPVAHEPLQKHTYQGSTWYLTGNDVIDEDIMPNLDGRWKIFKEKAPKHIQDIYARQENINFKSENGQMVNDFCAWVAGGKDPKQFQYTEVGEDNMASNASVKADLKNNEEETTTGGDLKDHAHMKWLMKQAESAKETEAFGHASDLSVTIDDNHALITCDDPDAFVSTVDTTADELLADDSRQSERDRMLNSVEDSLGDWMANHGMQWLAPEQVGALTDAPMFGEAEIDDHGNVTAVHSLYYFNDYALKDWRVELLENGQVEFTKHDEPNSELGAEAGVQMGKPPVIQTNVKATGEPDGDYDTELYDAISNELNKNGYQAEHEEFDKYQGAFIEVKKGGKIIAKLWPKDFYNMGETKDNPDVKYRKAVLIDADGNESSANAGDYFMMQPNEVFEDTILVLTDKNGQETQIDNPKKSDLPDLKDVSNTVEFEGEPDSVLVMMDEMGDPEQEFHLHVSADHQTVEIGELLEYLASKKVASGYVKAAKMDEPINEEAGIPPADGGEKPAAAPTVAERQTWGERMAHAKELYPDAEKLLDKMSKQADKDAIMQVNNTMSDSYSDSDKEIGGVDQELPYWLQDNAGGGAGYVGMVFGEGKGRGGQDGLAITSLRALAEMYPDLKAWMSNPENAYVSWGDSGGMMPYKHAEYPDDAILFWIEGHDTEEEIQYEINELAKQYGKAKDAAKFKQFLKYVSDEHLGTFYRYDGKGDHIEAYPRVQYVYACYFKLAEVMKAIKKAQKAKKDDAINQDEVKTLLENIKEGAGDYE